MRSCVLEPDACYRALVAHDPRFDGRFFVGVRSTRVYCRPVCTVRMPKRENCRFYPSAPAAERDGYRPCLRCRPELAPGFAAIDASARIVQAAVTLIDDGFLEDRSLEALAQPHRRDQPPFAARVRRRARRLAGRVRADAAAAACEAPADGHGDAGHRRCVRKRLFERAAAECAVQRALPDAAVAVADRPHRASGHADVRACVSPAVRVGCDARVPRLPRGRRHRALRAATVPACTCAVASRAAACRLGRGRAATRRGQRSRCGCRVRFRASSRRCWRGCVMRSTSPATPHRLRARSVRLRRRRRGCAFRADSTGSRSAFVRSPGSRCRCAQ